MNVEYVSANPTGPMHIGHCRGAVVGDALSNLLAKAGFAVTKEYYINDAGAQVAALAWAAYWRYLQAIGTALTEDDFSAIVPGCNIAAITCFLSEAGWPPNMAPAWPNRTRPPPHPPCGSISCARRRFRA